MARFSINTGQIVSLHPCKTEPLLGALVSLEDDFVLYVWNTQLNLLKHVIPLKHLTPKKPHFNGLCADTRFFYCQQGSKLIYHIDMKDGTVKKIESPKQVQSMFCHPLKPLLGTILADGTIRVINAVSNNATVWNEAGSHPGDSAPSASTVKDKPTPLTLSFHPNQSYMVATLSNGSICCWNMAASNKSEQYIGSMKISNSNETTTVFFHSTLGFLLTVAPDGSVTTWNFFPNHSKSWLIKIIDLVGRAETNPAHIEMANRYSHLPHYPKLLNDVISLTDMKIHPTYNLYSFNLRLHGKASGDVFHINHQLDAIRLGVYSFNLHDYQLYNSVVPQYEHLSFWATPAQIRIDKSKSTYKPPAISAPAPSTAPIAGQASTATNSALKDSKETSKESSALPAKGIFLNVNQAKEATDGYPLGLTPREKPVTTNSNLLTTSSASSTVSEPQSSRHTKPDDISSNHTSSSSLMNSSTYVNTFLFSNENYYLDDNGVIAYSPAYNDTSMAKKLPTSDFEGRLLRPTRIVRSKQTDRFLVFYLSQDPSKEESAFALSILTRDCATKDITVSPAAGQSGTFFGPADDDFIVLSESGMSVQVWKNEEETTLPMVYDLTFPMAEVFWTPLEGCNILLFMDIIGWRLVASSRNPIRGQKFVLNFALALQLWQEEIVLQVHWQKQEQPDAPLIAAVLTNRRVLIVDEKLRILASAQEVATSCLWLGASLLFSTQSHIKFLTFKNVCLPLISLRVPDAVLMAAICDRIALVIRKGSETLTITNAVGLLEPLVIGYLHYWEQGLQPDLEKKTVESWLHNCAESFDARRISWNLVEEATKHHFYEFALQLLLANAHLLSAHYQFAFELALMTQHFTTALSLIERSPMLQNASNFFRLQQASMRLGQFDLARKCAEASSDYTTLMYIYSLTKSREGFLLLKKKLERAGEAHHGLLTLVEKQLQRTDLVSTSPASAALINSLTASNTSGSQTAKKTADSSSSTSNSLMTTSSPRRPPVTALESRRPSSELITPIPTALPLRQSTNRVQYTNLSVLKNLPIVSTSAQKNWKVEVQLQLPSEMRTHPLDSGSGNLVIGPLLLNKLVGDWFTRQVQYFELPEALRGDAAQRAAILRLIAKDGATKAAIPIQSSKTNSGQSDSSTADRFRTTTVGGNEVPALPLSIMTTEGKRIAKSTASPVPLPSAPVGQAAQAPTLAPTANVAPPANQGDKSPRKGVVAPRVNTTIVASVLTVIANINVPQGNISGSNSTGNTPPVSKLGTGTTPTNSEDSPAGSPSYDIDANGGIFKKIDGSKGSEITTAHVIAVAERGLSLDPLDMMKAALEKIEKAEYENAYLDLNSVLFAIVAAGPSHSKGDFPHDAFSRHQIRFVVRYKIMCLLLLEICRLDLKGVEEVQIAHLAQFLADLQLVPRHRITVLRTALKKNIQVQNYGFASKCVDLLLSKQIPDDKKSLEKMKEQCSKQSNKDAEPLAVGTRLCMVTYQFIPPSQSCIVCIVCNTSFHINRVSLHSPCPSCMWRCGLFISPPQSQSSPHHSTSQSSYSTASATTATSVAVGAPVQHTNPAATSQAIPGSNLKGFIIHNDICV